MRILNDDVSYTYEYSENTMEVMSKYVQPTECGR